MIMNFIINKIKMINDKETNVKFDFTPHLVKAFATNDKAFNVTKNTYMRNKDEIDKLTKTSSFKNSPIIFNGNIEKDERMRKTLGVLEFIKQNNDNNILKQIMQTGWNDLYKLLKKDNVDLYKLIFDEKENTETFHNNKNTSKYIELSSEELGTQTVLAFIAHYYNNSHLMIVAEQLTDYLISIEDVINPSKKQNKSSKLSTDSSSTKKIENISKNFLEIISHAESFQELYLLQDDEEINKMLHSINNIYELENLPFNNLNNDDTITNEDILILAANYYFAHKNQHKEKSIIDMLYNLYIMKTIQAYKQAKKEYNQLNNTINKMFTQKDMNNHLKEIKLQNSELQATNNNLQKQLENLKFENERLRKNYKQTIEKDNIKLQREIQNLQNENENLLNTQTKLKTELEELEEFTNTLLSEENIENNDEEIDSIVSILNNFNILILGGHKGWHSRLSEKMNTNLVCIEGHNVNFDKILIDKKDFVFIYTDFMSHGFYRKIIKRMKGQGIPFGYINSTSINYAIKEMYDFIINIENN